MPQFALYLTGRRPPDADWAASWVRWPDFWLPSDPEAARTALSQTWERAGAERVEIACGGGRGRTGTALACLARLDGLSAPDAIAYIRAHYHRGAVETPWQRRFVSRFKSAQ